MGYQHTNFNWFFFAGFLNHQQVFTNHKPRWNVWNHKICELTVWDCPILTWWDPGFLKNFVIVEMIHPGKLVLLSFWIISPFQTFESCFLNFNLQIGENDPDLADILFKLGGFEAPHSLVLIGSLRAHLFNFNWLVGGFDAFHLLVLEASSCCCCMCLCGTIHLTNFQSLGSFVYLVYWKLRQQKSTLPETNIAPENGGSQHESPFPEVYFQVRTVSFREGI